MRKLFFVRRGTIKKYRYYLDAYLETVGYCLMPTHFHFLVRVRILKDVQHLRDVGHLKAQSLEKDVQHFESVGHLETPDISPLISRALQTLQSSYTKAINKRYNRHGSLFQAHYNAKLVPSNRYLITLLTYIHQNPVRSKLVERAEDWRFSSYQDYINFRDGSLPSKELILGMIKKEDLREMTKSLIKEI